MRKVFPFLKNEYFHDEADRVVFGEITKFIDKYNECPTTEAIGIMLQKSDDIPEHTYDSVEEIIASIEKYEPSNDKWLLDTTEKFCKDKSVFNAIMKSIGVIEGRDKDVSPDGIPKILQDALAVCFDTNVGHDYLDKFDDRWEFYHQKESRLPFNIELLNKITGGGLPTKSLSVVLAPTGVGKTLVMCHLAAANLSMGKNVLYITMEMAEERIAERIDANLMDVPLSELKGMTKPMFESRIGKIKDKTQGKLIIKEYPTAGAHSGHFKMLLNELALKRNFVPDVIYIDYLNICSSSRYKASAAVNSYTMVKAIAEELRGMAVEAEVPIITATQTNRSGFGNSDIELTDTSESIGLPATVDFMFALISSEELEKMGQLMIKQLKNRFGDPNLYKRFVVGIDRSRMKLYDLDIAAQQDVSNEVRSNEKDNSNSGFNRGSRQRDFSDFNV